jgi:hypothetical protein
MKYIKLYEDIDWDWNEEEYSMFKELEKNLKYRSNKYPIIVRIHKKHIDEFNKLILKYNFPMVKNLLFYKLNTVYLFIRKKTITFMTDKDISDYNYVRNSNPNCKIIEIL